MFKLLEPVAYGITGAKVLGKLYATTKEEVQTGVPIIGLPADRSLASGSWGYTQAGDLFIYDETEGFAFVGEEDSSAKSAPSLNLERPVIDEGLKKSISDEEPIEEEEPIKEEEPDEEPEIEEKAVKE
jgi:hypothetical protein